MPPHTTRTHTQTNTLKKRKKLRLSGPSPQTQQWYILAHQTGSQGPDPWSRSHEHIKVQRCSQITDQETVAEPGEPAGEEGEESEETESHSAPSFRFLSETDVQTTFKNNKHLFNSQCGRVQGLIWFPTGVTGHDDLVCRAVTALSPRPDLQHNISIVLWQRQPH